MLQESAGKSRIADDSRASACRFRRPCRSIVQLYPDRSAGWRQAALRLIAANCSVSDSKLKSMKADAHHFAGSVIGDGQCEHFVDFVEVPIAGFPVC